MSTTARRLLVTSALPYANGPIHLGHLVEYIQTDIWVRFQKSRGHECHYVCADDAHGTAIMLKAEQNGVTPEEQIATVKADHERAGEGRQAFRRAGQGGREAREALSGATRRDCRLNPLPTIDH